MDWTHVSPRLGWEERRTEVRVEIVCWAGSRTHSCSTTIQASEGGKRLSSAGPGAEVGAGGAGGGEDGCTGAGGTLAGGLEAGGGAGGASEAFWKLGGPDRSASVSSFPSRTRVITQSIHSLAWPLFRFGGRSQLNLRRARFWFSVAGWLGSLMLKRSLMVEGWPGGLSFRL